MIKIEIYRVFFLICQWMLFLFSIKIICFAGLTGLWLCQKKFFTLIWMIQQTRYNRLKINHRTFPWFCGVFVVKEWVGTVWQTHHNVLIYYVLINMYRVLCSSTINVGNAFGILESLLLRANICTCISFDCWLRCKCFCIVHNIEIFPIGQFWYSQKFN